jgi:hypothetical protein
MLTRAEPVDDESLREPVTAEEMKRLGLIRSRVEVERLSLLHDFDALPAKKLRSWIDAGTPGIRGAG